MLNLNAIAGLDDGGPDTSQLQQTASSAFIDQLVQARQKLMTIMLTYRQDPVIPMVRHVMQILQCSLPHHCVPQFSQADLLSDLGESGVTFPSRRDKAIFCQASPS
jgi:hypothetical protein